MALVRAAPLFVVALAACASQPAPLPQHAGLLAASDRQHGGIDRVPTPELRRYCMSAYWAKQRDKLAACLGEMRARRTWLGVIGRRDCAESTHACDLLARELHLGALTALDDGDFAGAIRIAGDLRAMHRERAGFRYEAVDALGVLAVAGRDDALAELKQFGFGPFSGMHYERIWLARAYMARRDYEKAYQEVRRIDFGFDALTERTLAAYAPTGEADGYRFIRGKSALETGRVEEARAMLARLSVSALAPSKTGCVVLPSELELDQRR